MPDYEYDVVIVGAGPGGYVAAIRAAQLGLKTVVVEEAELGGVCLNWGCIPSKALLRNAEVLRLVRRSEEFGISFDNLRYDFGVAIDRSRVVVDKLTNGVAALLRKNKVEHVKARASLTDAHTVVTSPNGHVLTAANIVLATGAQPASIPGLTLDGERIITSREALELREIPPRITIVGGGATGVEFAYLYNAYGSHITVIELLQNLLPSEDEEISTQLERSFLRQGINFYTSTKVTGAKLSEGCVSLEIDTAGDTTSVESDLVLVAAGVRPNTQGIGLEELGIIMDRGFIQVNSSMKTSVAGVYAIGDVTGKMLLAHVAQAQGVLAVERIAGLEPLDLDYQVMPRATYCNPQVTSYGFTEEEAREAGHTVKVGKFPFLASGKALATGDSEGIVKVVINASSDEILGVHMIGPEVTELLAEFSLLKALEGTTREMGALVHSHPTLSEVLKEAALAADGEAIHI